MLHPGIGHDHAKRPVTFREMRTYTRRAQQQADRTAANKQDPHKETIQCLEKECAELRTRIQALDKRVPLKSIHEADKIVHHEGERKTITQLIKVVAYRSESCLARLIEPMVARHDDEIRAFLKAVFRLPGDIVPDYPSRQLRVRLYTMANNRSRQALLALCELLNAQRIDYPGTDLRLVDEAIQSH